jgi:hypothetical protein
MSRVRGLAPWSPQQRTLPLLDAIGDVLRESAPPLPRTSLVRRWTEAAP